MASENQESVNSNGWQWRHIGMSDTLHIQRCRRLYSMEGKKHDLALFFTKNQFYAMEAWCSHMGGPLHQGDIEDYKGSPHILCPWHGYMFDINSGKNDIGLQQETYKVKVDGGQVFVWYKSDLSINPFP